MKPIFITWIASLLLCHICSAQNLIRNESFDEVLPYSHGNNASQKRHHFTDNTRFWDSPTGGTPDIWLEKYRSDPKRNKGMGPLKPRTGESMIGIRIYGCDKIFGSHCREYIQTKTKETLQAGKCYEYEFHALSTVAGIRINNIGIGFSEFKINDLTNGIALDLDYKFQEEEIVHKGVGKWVKISGSFTPDKDYNHIIIGNFSDDKNTKIRKLDNGSYFAYYFIDDVSVYKTDCGSGNRIDIQESYSLGGITFEHNSSEITKVGRTNIKRIYEKLMNQEFSTIQINGHTDNSGTTAYNMKLSEKRAKTVLNQLVTLGMPRSKMTSVAHGSSQPLDTNDKSKNRRVEIIID